jgi:hypothetical protein
MVNRAARSKVRRNAQTGICLFTNNFQLIQDV